MTPASNAFWTAMMAHVFNFWYRCWSHRNSPTEFVLVANPLGDVLLDFLMTYEHGPLDLSSCILRGMIGLHYGVIDYYVMVCITVNWLIYLEPGPPPPIWDITLLWWKVWWPRLSLREMTPSCSGFTISTGSGPGAIWRSNLVLPTCRRSQGGETSKNYNQ